MDFGYFSLTDNHYIDNRRSANDCIRDVVDEAVYAEQLGLHSAWVGEHHFNSLGVLSSPDLALAYIAAQTKRIRLAPAVTVLPLHHPIRVAEQWATLDLLSNGRVDFATGRGYDRNEYVPFDAPFDDNVAAFTEGLEVVQRLWSSPEPVSHRGKYYSFENVAITPQPIQRPIPVHVAAFSRPTVELAARFGCGLVVAAFAAAITLGGLRQVADMYREACAKYGTKPGRMISSYFLHFADTPEQKQQALHRQVRYWRECGGAVHVGTRETAPKSYDYYFDFKEKMLQSKPEEITERAVLLGNAAQIADTLKTLEAIGFSEVILYFGVGLKPHAQVKDEMARFMAEVAPAFRG
ncbi:MAG TPA: LLM class flavin-dependent oxidoreductase [Stellaceae bacterium]|jgi:alkanesulfonate monooxygenase SsuD/methylene tetrahydromethanopterin reductase-like flavin-dependent oxidoreductase (luciferase family)